MLQIFDDNDEGAAWKFPLLLSTLAGASTCVGAAVVFCFSAEVIRDTMTFSLALAGSVMITVSVISIGPECLNGIAWTMDEAAADEDEEDSSFTPMYLLFARLCWFFGGCISYILLSKLAFPEPTDLVLEGGGEGGHHAHGGGGGIGGHSSHAISKSPRDVLTEENYEMQKLMGPADSDGFGSHPSSNTSTTNDKFQPRRSSTFSSDDGDGAEAFSATRKKDAAQARQRRSPKSPKSPCGRSEDDKSAGSYSNQKQKHSKSTHAVFQWSSGADLQSDEAKRSWRVAMLLFVSLLCHNFPEGLAVAASTMESRHLGITVAVGILIHNIPEGIAIAVPCVAARPDSPWLAFLLASGSGLAEPLGAFLALCVLPSGKRMQTSAFLSMECILASVAGIMISVAFVELYPEAWRHGMGQWKDAAKTMWSIGLGTVLGAVMMVITELCI